MAHPITKPKAPAGEPRISRNGTAQNQPQESSSEIDKAVLANITLVVWLIFLTIGGGLLALYYARIGYLPEIEWKTSLIYLFVGSMIGGAIGLLLIIALFIPGVLWSEYIIFDPCLEKHFSYDLESKEPCLRSIITNLGKPFFLLLLVSHVILLLGRAFIVWPLAALILIATFLLMRLRLERIFVMNFVPNGEAQDVDRVENAKRTLRELWQPRRVKAMQTFKYSAWFTLSVLLSQISMYVIYRLSGSMPFSLRFVALTLLCTGGVWISNHIVAFHYHNSPRQAVVASLVAAGLLLFTADSFSSLSMNLMNHFGIGYDQRVNVLVNEHGSGILCGLGKTECGRDRLDNVEILSKLGDQYYLKIGENTYVTLPKEDVRAISRIDLDLTQTVKN